MAAIRRIKLTTNEHELTLIKLLLVCAVMLLLGGKAYAEKSISTLIEEATYQEETVGDVNAAIVIYQQVIADDHARRPQVARATYGAGMCYLKKGDKDKAAQLFNEVVTKFADQKVFVTKAQAELKKLGQVSADKTEITQEMRNDIDADGLIHFKSPKQVTNNGTEPLTVDQFYNSDFVKLTRMSDANGKEIEFETTHQNNKYRYVVAIDPPVQPGSSFTYYMEGTIKGLINSVEGQDGVFKYFMRHSPAAGKPVLRIETYLLPKGAELISRTPEAIQVTEESGRIKLLHKAIVPAGGSILTSFKYKLKEGGRSSNVNNKSAAENLTTQGWQLWKERKLAEAEETFKKAIEKDPQAEGAYQGLGWAQLNQGKKLNAEESFKKCVELNPKNSAALNGLGWIAKGESKTDEAIEWWKKAVEAAPGATAALQGLADTYLEKKQYEKAGEYYKQILQYEPQNKQAQIGLDKATNKGKLKIDDAQIQTLIKELDNPNAPKFEALNVLVDIGEPAVKPLINAMKNSNNWQIAKALGAIKNKQAVKLLIEKWQTANFSPMKEVIAEALESITGQKFGADLAKWQEWDKANK